MEKQYSGKKKRRPRIKLADAPPINSINDLIKIGQSIKFYKNLDMITLWRITPYLEEMNNLVGMKTLKESLFYQILYYIQGLHLRNQSEEYLHTIITGDPGCGKCLAKDTPVLMYDGTIKMVQNIKQGEQIMGDDSTARNVISTTSGTEMMYRVEQGYGDDYTVNESHILSLKLSKSPRVNHRQERQSFQVKWFDERLQRSKTFSYRGGSSKEQAQEDAEYFASSLPQNGSVIDIPVTEYLATTQSWKTAYKGYKVGVDYPTRGVPLDPYILGCWLGDGTSAKPQFTSVDNPVVEAFRQAYPELEIRVNNSGITYDVTSGVRGGSQEDKATRNLFWNHLKQLNLVGNKHIPDEYLINSTEVRKQLLAGIIDTDGYKNSKACYDIVQKNKKLALQIVFLARSLGYRATVSECQKSCWYKGSKKTGVYHRVTLSGADDLPVRLQRKKVNGVKRIDKSNTVYTIKVVKTKVDKYFGFELDGNRRFVLGDFTVTHNTTVAKIIAKIYQGLGILSKNGSFKIAHRDDFIAGYLGQTALKTQKLLKSCLGGVLFIDEVYALAPRKEDKDSFSKEALDILCSFLSEHANDFCCIAAGYEKDINECFFAMNQGLKRRFPWVHKIDEYTSDDLSQILCNKIREMNWELSTDVKIISQIIENNKELFKYTGGDIENFVTKCKIAHARRVISLDKEHKFVLTREDLEKGLEMMKNTKTVVKLNPPPWGLYM
jgi:hypothetical protein